MTVVVNTKPTRTLAMAQITATTNEVERLVTAFAQRDISGLTFLFNDGKVSVENIKVEGVAEVKGLPLTYSVKLSKDDGMTATIILK